MSVVVVFQVSRFCISLFGFGFSGENRYADYSC